MNYYFCYIVIFCVFFFFSCCRFNVKTLTVMCVLLGFTVPSVVSGADLKCSYSADFGADARVEWKFQDMKGSQTYVIFDGKPTGEWNYQGWIFL